MSNNKPSSNFGLIDGVIFLRKYLLKYKRTIIFLLLGWLLQGLLTIVLPVLFGILIDEMVYYKNMDTFVHISLLILSLSVFLCTLYFVIYTFHIHLNGKYAFDIKMDLFDHLLSLETKYVDEAKSGDIINTIQSYTSECFLLVKDNLIYFFLVSIYILLYTSYIFMVDWKIGLIVLVFAPVSAYLTMRNSIKIRHFSDNYRVVYGQYIGWLFELFNGIKDIRLLRAEKFIHRGFTKKYKDLFQLTNNKNLYTLNLNNLIEAINLVMQLTIFGVGAYLTIKGSMTIGMLVVIIGFFGQIKFNIIILNQYYVNLQDRLSAVKYIKDFKDLPIEQNQAKQRLTVTIGEISLTNIEFSYQDRPNVINRLSLTIKPNERVALVGKSGCGKTTLVNMLVGFLVPQHGVISIDGHNLSDYSLKSIRSEVGIVQQSVLIFDETIRENLRLGNLRATDQDIIDACAKTGLSSFINKLDNGLDTVIGSKGVGLSGGQKQLIAITRIYLKNPKIIIFDEATSALDSETEQMVHNAWNTLLINKTVIVISHKISSVMQCDRVVLLEEGKIVEDGEIHTVLHSSERFRQLFSVGVNG